MRKKLLLLTPLLFAGLFIADGFFQAAHTNGTGAPPGNTGSPDDGTECAKSCHLGAVASAKVGWISSDIPSSGYVPGNTYTFTATAIHSGSLKFGFQISPQDINGNLMGTLIASNTTETQLVGSGKYITHKSGGTAGSGSRTWTFQWKAPMAGTGNVTFYGAFNGSKSNNHQSGDKIYTSTLTVNEDPVSIGFEFGANIISMAVYPNPVADFIGLYYTLKDANQVVVNLYSVEGKKVDQLLNVFESKGKQEHKLYFTQKYPAGLYFLELKTGDNNQLRKLVIQ